MLSVPLNLPVGLWNAIKFLVIQLLTSVLFANAWHFFVHRRAEELLSRDHIVAIRSTNLGRLTPANVIHEVRGGTRFENARISVLLVNLLLLACVLLTEFGSSSVRRSVTKKLPIVNRHTIKRFNSEQNRLIEDSLSVPSFSLQQDLLPSALEALQRKDGATGALPMYEIQEHLRDTNETMELIRNKENDLVLSNVCGVDMFNSNSSCARFFHRRLGLTTRTSALLFTVTRHLTLDIPELSMTSVDEALVQVRLDAVMDGAMEQTSKHETFHSIVMRPRDITGVCAGLPQMLSDEMFHESVGVLTHCVLVDGNMRYVLTHAKKWELSKAVERELTRSPEGYEWTRIRSTIALPISTSDAISFRGDIGPLFALANVMRLGDVRDQLRDFDDLPIGETLRKAVVLRAFGLIGPYAENQEVRVQFIDSTVAAVNVLFFAGLCALFVLMGSIFIFGLVGGKTHPNGRWLPIDFSGGQRMLNQLHCAGLEENCIVCNAMQDATFVNGGNRAAVKSHRMQNAKARLSLDSNKYQL